MDHFRGAPLHSQTQGKIDCWHQTLKNRIPLENCYLSGDLGQKVCDFVAVELIEVDANPLYLTKIIK